MRTGQEVIVATKRYAEDSTAKSWWHILSTAFLLLIALAGTHWNIHPAGKGVMQRSERLVDPAFVRDLSRPTTPRHPAAIPARGNPDAGVWHPGFEPEQHLAQLP